MGDIKIKIFYDDQIFTIQKYGGISRYFSNLIFMNNEAFCSSIISQNEYIKAPLKYSKKSKILTLVSVIINRVFTLFQLRFKSYNIFHPTYYNTYFLDHLKEPFVLTVYDMIHEIYPDITKDEKLSANKKLLCENAARIICISNQTKKDLIRFLNTDPRKIDVIHLATDYIPISRYSLSRVIIEEYILFVGNRTGYKNFDVFLKSIYMLLKEHNLKLVCSGGGQFSLREQELFRQLNIEDRLIQISADETKLKSLYNNALMFVFPSDYEGFGIPILEAYACGCPVVLSQNDCFKEVAGNAGAYFDQNNAISIHESIKSVIGSEELQNDLVKLGYQRLMNYSWENTYKQTLEVYAKAIKNEK